MDLPCFIVLDNVPPSILKTQRRELNFHLGEIVILIKIMLSHKVHIQMYALMKIFLCNFKVEGWTHQQRRFQGGGRGQSPPPPGGFRGGGKGATPPPLRFWGKKCSQFDKKKNVLSLINRMNPLFKLFEGITIFIKSSVRENMFF